METIITSIDIEAAPQTVWSVLDDFFRYPEWNPVVPEMKGRTTLGQALQGQLKIGDTVLPLAPTINRVVGAREFRWMSTNPEFNAEHIFEMQPTKTGTHLIHREIFNGPGVEPMAGFIQGAVKPAYESFNQVFKERAERFAKEKVALHPRVDAGDKKGAENDSVTLRCHCASEPVEVRVTAPIQHNHLCGCSKCWKPEGALLAQTAVVASGAAEVTANAQKLRVVDASQKIKRYACTGCGVHMIGKIDDTDYHFYGVDFIHPELAVSGDTPYPEFAGFVSSVIETGTNASLMQAVRARLAAVGIPAFDAFSPELMDIIAFHKVKMART